MAGRQASRDAITREQWAARIAFPTKDRVDQAHPARRGRPALSLQRILAEALTLIESDGYESLTMRSLATALDTGPASLYAHVENKAELGDLLVGELCSRVQIPVPDRKRWQEQMLAVCSRLREEFLRYPGVARAALAVVPADLEPLRLAEGLLTILLAGGATPQDAAWASDAAFLYVTAYCLEAADAGQQNADRDGAKIDRDEIAKRLQMLPPHEFPNTVTHVQELTAGNGHARFDFTLKLLMRGLESSS